ncbi:Neutral ceramidase 2 [Glycine soja]|uniref:ceramidase n=1 Tax=Glycine soja TaxID=3848 RepID=A0A445F0W0_GLYSO|nr:Neutral ceramidase 2 [Glycine soja]
MKVAFGQQWRNKNNNGILSGMKKIGIGRVDKINPFWKNVRDFLKEPSQHQEHCQKPKPVLLSTGEMFFPYPWAGPSRPDNSSIPSSTNRTGQSSLVLETLTGPELLLTQVRQSLTKKRLFYKGRYTKATFWSSNPRYDLLTEGTFAVVERLQEERWISVYDDDDLSLFFRWKVDNSSLHGLATIEWEIPNDAVSGLYRLKHFGATRTTIISPINYFTGFKCICSAIR